MGREGLRGVVGDDSCQRRERQKQRCQQEKPGSDPQPGIYFPGGPYHAADKKPAARRQQEITAEPRVSKQECDHKPTGYAQYDEGDQIKQRALRHIVLQAAGADS